MRNSQGRYQVADPDRDDAHQKSSGRRGCHSLIALKKAGADDATVAALSAYAVKPNDHFNLAVRMDEGCAKFESRAVPLHRSVECRKNRQEALLHADLRKRLSTTGGAIVQRDRSDPLLPQNVRSIRFRTQVKTRTPGAYKFGFSLESDARLDDHLNGLR